MIGLIICKEEKNRHISNVGTLNKNGKGMNDNDNDSINVHTQKVERKTKFKL